MDVVQRLFVNAISVLVPVYQESSARTDFVSRKSIEWKQFYFVFITSKSLLKIRLSCSVNNYQINVRPFLEEDEQLRGAPNIG